MVFPKWQTLFKTINFHCLISRVSKVHWLVFTIFLESLPTFFETFSTVLIYEESFFRFYVSSLIWFSLGHTLLHFRHASFFSPFSTFHSVSSITDSYFFAAIVFLVNHSLTKFQNFVVEAMIPPQISCYFSKPDRIWRSLTAVVSCNLYNSCCWTLLRNIP